VKRLVTARVSLNTAILIFAWGWSCGCLAGIIRHDRPAEAYQKLGKAQQFQCVGEVVRDRKPDERRMPSFSAVLVAPRWALTARHIAVRELEKHRYIFGGQEYRAVRCVTRPVQIVIEAGQDVALAGIAAGDDIALVQLDRPVTNVKPAERYRGNAELGRIMTKVGYGCIGDGLTGMKLPVTPETQERRAGQNVIDLAGGMVGKLAVSNHVLAVDFDHPTDPALNQLGDPAPLELEIGVSSGDSGGGWFIAENGSWKLVAIGAGFLPSTAQPPGPGMEKYGSVLAGTRISTANNWIDEVLRTGSPRE